MLLSQGRVPLTVPAPALGKLPAGAQPRRRVLPDDLQQPVASARSCSVCRHKGFVDQPGQHFDGSGLTGYLLGSMQAEPACEDGQPPEQHAFPFGQQLMTPIQRGGQSPLPVQPAAAQVAGHAEHVLEPIGEFSHRQVREPRSSELQGQGDAVQLPAHPSDWRRDRSGQGETRNGVPSPLDEQLDCLRAVYQGLRTRLRQLQRGDPPAHLPRYAQRFTARGDDHQAGTAGEQRSHQFRTTSYQVLAVVQEDQHVPTGELVHERLRGQTTRGKDEPQLSRDG